jgi:exodeoxyribonuclease VII small subunit
MRTVHGFAGMNRLKSAIPFLALYSMPKAAATSPQPDAPSVALPASYEAAMAELESLTARLESGDMPLDQLLTGYQRGASLLQYCREKLQAVEDQIKVLDDGALKNWKP